MAPNGEAVRAALAPGHFLFTSESVGEGHPGMWNTAEIVKNFVEPCLIRDQTKSVTRSPTPSYVLYNIFVLPMAC